MSVFTIERLRAKINSYIELFNRIRENGDDPNDTSDARVLETLRPLILIHWSKNLMQIPEDSWKDVCVEIVKIDKARDKAKNAARLQEKKMAIQIQEENDRQAAELAAKMLEDAEKQKTPQQLLQEEIDHKLAMALAAEMEAADKAAAALAAAAALVDCFTMDDDQRADFLMFEDAERPDSPCIRHANSRFNMLDE